MAELTALAAVAPPVVSSTSGVTESTVSTPVIGAGLSKDFLAEIGLVEPTGSIEDVIVDVPPTDTPIDPTVAEVIEEVVIEDDAEEIITDAQKKVWPQEAYDRLSKVSAKKNEFKAQVETLTAELEEVKAQLATPAEVPSFLPSSPLAHIDSLESLKAENVKVINFLKQAKDLSLPSTYTDYDDITEVSQMFEHDQAYAMRFLEMKDAHSEILTQRETISKELRKSNPSLFDPKAPEYAERIKLHSSDPRSNPDYDQFIADAIAGRNARMKKPTVATGKPKAKDAPPAYTPPAATRAPVVPSNIASPKDDAWNKAKNQVSVSCEEMEMAGAFL